MQSNMQLNQESKKHFEILKPSLNKKKNVKHIDLKTHTHTHTHNKSNQFLFQKPNQDNLVSIY